MNRLDLLNILGIVGLWIGLMFLIFKTYSLEYSMIKIKFNNCLNTCFIGYLYNSSAFGGDVFESCANGCTVG